MFVKVFLKTRKSQANGIYDTVSECIRVSKGSQVSKNLTKHFAGTQYETIRNDLVANEVISNDRFTKDYLFDSPSQASSVILGSNSNGKREWKTSEGISISALDDFLTARNRKYNFNVDYDIEDNQDHLQLPIRLILETREYLKWILPEIEKTLLDAITDDKTGVDEKTIHNLRQTYHRMKNENPNREDIMYYVTESLDRFYGLFEDSTFSVDVFIYNLNVDARAVYYSENDTITVKKGSTIINSSDPDITNQVESLIREGIIIEGRFSTDYTFDDVDDATGVVIGEKTDGKTVWKTEEGLNIHNITEFD